MGYTANSVEEGQWSGYFKRKRRLAKPLSGVSKDFPALCRPYRVARTVPPLGAGNSARRRLRRGKTVRRLAGAGRLFWSYHPVRDALYSTAAFPEQMDFRIRANNETSPK